jgi:hypothetical protein
MNDTENQMVQDRLFAFFLMGFGTGVTGTLVLLMVGLIP